ncbi:MAG: DUF6299 family protein [Chloroflexota bacterium]|nr:DUF6299 family protein [Chloroflexota bacterium]
MKRITSIISLLFVLSLALAVPVMAAAPGNDTYAGRTVISSLPFNESLDTSEATTDADDAEANAECGAPATDASVWYEMTASSDGGILVDVSQSSYSAGVLVVTGSPGNFEIVTCGPEAVFFFGEAGTTYALLAIDDQFDGGGNGGTLVITVDEFEIPPSPEIDVTVNPTGTFNPRTGSAIISGTVTCTGDVEFAFIDVELRQRVGRFTINGFGSIEPACDGTTQPWSVEVFGSNGLFKGGQAVSVTFAVACGFFDCGVDFEETTVRLRR